MAILLLTRVAIGLGLASAIQLASVTTLKRGDNSKADDRGRLPKDCDASMSADLALRLRAGAPETADLISKHVHSQLEPEMHALAVWRGAPHIAMGGDSFDRCQIGCSADAVELGYGRPTRSHNGYLGAGKTTTPTGNDGTQLT